jgi:hypothetical protein
MLDQTFGLGFCSQTLFEGKTTSMFAENSHTRDILVAGVVRSICFGRGGFHAEPSHG